MGGRTKREVFVKSYYTIMASAQYLLHGSWGDGRPWFIHLHSNLRVLGFDATDCMCSDVSSVISV
jgi:hypothetical protein